MSGPDLAVYSGDALNPAKIADNLHDTKLAGWTTILLGLFHVGGQPGTVIYFNDLPVIVDGSLIELFKGWQQPLHEILEARIVRRIYASFGRGEPVQDFSNIYKIYQNNNNSFAGTMLETHLKICATPFRRLPASQTLTSIPMTLHSLHSADWFEGWALTSHFAASELNTHRIFGFGSTACRRLSKAAGAKTPSNA